LCEDVHKISAAVAKPAVSGGCQGRLAANALPHGQRLYEEAITNLWTVLAPGGAPTPTVDGHRPRATASLRGIPGTRFVAIGVAAAVVAAVELQVGRLIATETLVVDDGKNAEHGGHDMRVQYARRTSKPTFLIPAQRRSNTVDRFLKATDRPDDARAHRWRVRPGSAIRKDRRSRHEAIRRNSATWNTQKRVVSNRTPFSGSHLAAVLHSHVVRVHAENAAYLSFGGAVAGA